MSIGAHGEIAIYQADGSWANMVEVTQFSRQVMFEKCEAIALVIEADLIRFVNEVSKISLIGLQGSRLTEALAVEIHNFKPP